MKIYLNHVAMNVDNYEWYKDFFAEVLGMTSYREDRTGSGRKIWFVEGIQLNEVKEKNASSGSSFSHFGILTEDVEKTVGRAAEAGCSLIEEKKHWFVLPNGIQVEVKAIGTVPER